MAPSYSARAEIALSNQQSPTCNRRGSKLRQRVRSVLRTCLALRDIVGVDIADHTQVWHVCNTLASPWPNMKAARDMSLETSEGRVGCDRVRSIEINFSVTTLLQKENPIT